MGQLGMISILGRAATDKTFLDQLCKHLQNGDRDGLVKFLRFTAQVDLSEKELDYLLKERKRDICKCLRELSTCLEIEYGSGTEDRDPKRY